MFGSSGRSAPQPRSQKICNATPLPLEINKRVAEMTRAFAGRRIGDRRRGPSANAERDFSPMDLIHGEPEEPPSCPTATTTLLTKPHRRINSTLPVTAHGLNALSVRSEEHTSELQSLRHLVCRLL